MACFSGPEIVNNGLVLHLDAANLKSYGGSGTTWSDLSGNANHATLVNGLTYDSSQNGSFILDGVSDYAVSTGGYHLNPQLTISIWFKLANTISSSYSVGRLWGTGGDFEARWDGGTLDGYLRLDVGGTLNLQTSKNVWSNTIWHNVTATLDSSTNTSKLYVQSELDSTGTCGNYSTQSSPIQIGRSASGGGSPLAGRISNFTIYNRVLTNTEVKQNFEALRGRYGI